MVRQNDPAKRLAPEVDAALKGFVSALMSTGLSAQKNSELCDKAGEWVMANARAAVIDHVIQNSESPSEEVH